MNNIYNAKRAWLIAFSVFACFWLLAWLTGVIDVLLRQAIASPQQLADPVWWLTALLITGFVLFAYGKLWSGKTLCFQRQRQPLSQILFGLIWGVSFSLYFLTLWHFAQWLLTLVFIDSSIWAVWCLAYLFISLWQALFMDMFWDLYVSPEHDTAASKQQKVMLTHIPNLTMSLIFLAVYQNYWLFIGWQTTALVICSVAMRMPSPWSEVQTLAARAKPSILFGLPRAAGYQSE
ncbi:hypothetical protein E2K93_08960 [Thalassotalea sp. HSM 43]|uniref:hypothetical protein n=1 Tax=Thalassotalea sp. HSM 43 TaxID=2552945 RepID=UPI001080ECBA|nr:hypothetical protein [Thalassotalea sp. HSM 43]QBY04510.1 hypothetical protein E2K93_08960 [Thalassotalea sp. HSM 43]